MTRLFCIPAGRAALALALVIGTLAVAAGAHAQAPAPAPGPGPSPQGLYKSGESTLRVTVTRNEARGVFAEVSPGARNLGFKPADVSFVAAISGTMMHGEQTVRYGPKCHPNGRKVPMMGRLTPNGQVLAIHFYMVETDANYRDTGQYRVTETLWQRVAER